MSEELKSPTLGEVVRVDRNRQEVKQGELVSLLNKSPVVTGKPIREMSIGRRATLC